MFGRIELERLAQERETLVAESGLNRLVLRAEIQNLRDATAWLSEANRWSRKASPLLLLLAPLTGFLLAKGSRRTASWLNRVTAAAKWIAPLFTLWKTLSASRKATDAGEPTA